MWVHLHAFGDTLGLVHTTFTHTRTHTLRTVKVFGLSSEPDELKTECVCPYTLHHGFCAGQNYFRDV
jgi:hypothetical protein